MKYFETRFLEEADEFISELESKTIKKIFYNIDLAEQTNDPKLLKKLQNDIWEFRTKFAGLQIRLLAFWDKTDNKESKDHMENRSETKTRQKKFIPAEKMGDHLQDQKWLRKIQKLNNHMQTFSKAKQR